MDPMIGSALIGAGGSALGMLGGVGQGNRGYHRNKKLMGFQRDHQMQLNRQGADIQYDMWRKTNMPAQVKMMEEAGLNPALMYGMGGAGGSTTGSQGGGSASGGSAPGESVMDLQNALIGAQIGKLVEETRKVGNEADNIGGPQKEKLQQEVKEIGARIENLGKEKERIIAETNKAVSDKERIDIENAINNLDKEFYEEHDLAPGDFWMIKALKRAGVDIYDGLKWIMNVGTEEAKALLTFDNEYDWKNKNE